MSQAPAPVVPATTAKKVAKKDAAPKVAKPKVSKPKVEPTHPKFIDMIIDGLKKLNERSGSSRQALLKYITATYTTVDPIKANKHIKLALASGVKSGHLKHVKGVGATGSFKVGDAAKVQKKKAEKKPKVAKPAGEKKVVKAKKPAAAKKVVKKVASGEEKPKKNVKKIVKPKLPKAVSPSKQAVEAASKAKVAKPKVKKAPAATKPAKAAAKPATAAAKTATKKTAAAKKPVAKKAAAPKKAAN